MRALCIALVFVVGALVSCPSICHGEDTIALYGDTGDGLARFIYTGSDVFDIVVHTNTAEGASALPGVVLTELAQVAPGVLRVGVVQASGALSYVEGEGVTEYVVYYNGCEESGSLDAIRVSYLDLTGTSIGHDTVLNIRALRSGDLWWREGSNPLMNTSDCDWPACAGPPSYCQNPLTPERWSEDGMPDREDLAGAVVLNPSWLPVEGETASMGTLKARY